VDTEIHNLSYLADLDVQLCKALQPLTCVHIPLVQPGKLKGETLYSSRILDSNSGRSFSRELERVTRVGLVDLGLILGSDVIYSQIYFYPVGCCVQVMVL